MDYRRSDNESSGEGLAALLRDLPSAAPPHDRWASIAARARRQRRTRIVRRAAVPLAMAASIALLVAIVWQRRPLPTPACGSAGCTAQASADSKAASGAVVAQLRAQSSATERWLHQLEAGSPPLSGQALAQRVALEDQIALIDLQLDGSADADARATLWRQRVTHLQRIALLQLSADAVAESSPEHRVPTRAAWIN